MLNIDIKAKDYLKTYKSTSSEEEDKVDAVAYSSHGEEQYYHISVRDILCEAGYFSVREEETAEEEQEQGKTLRQLIKESLQRKGRMTHGRHYYANQINIYPCHKVEIKDIKDILQNNLDFFSSLLAEKLFTDTEKISDMLLFNELCDRLNYKLS